MQASSPRACSFPTHSYPISPPASRASAPRTPTSPSAAPCLPVTRWPAHSTYPPYACSRCTKRNGSCSSCTRWASPPSPNPPPTTASPSYSAAARPRCWSWHQHIRQWRTYCKKVSSRLRAVGRLSLLRCHRLNPVYKVPDHNVEFMNLTLFFGNKISPV